MRHFSTTFKTRGRYAAMAAGLALTLVACNSNDAAAPTTPRPSQGIVAGTLEATAAKPTLTLRNTTEFVVGYMVVDKDMATVALFPPCGQNCPTIVQGQQATVDYSRIAGYTERSTEAIVMWWTYQRAADGTLAPTGGVNSTRVRL
ncbi:MAG: hypothetical protein LCH84_09020 [Gemmatimonadetes bacterium]|nr:hypothetical protein [Gemmatimonadota bacterium]